ncbi:MAG TPA: UDP-4-amino-4,6-dideoxy-N-acetyl-beta-L-altrosamine transaminase [Candidatus Omnitrophica bacterium]|nr:UDP-4-amino-4,6-dideoxy-N-acetyl-beta-L-altrosamine transaminase [Candidatus Omnitrophota bacterium]
MKIDFFKHNIGKDELKRVSSVLKSTFLTTGPVTKEFENNLSRYLNVMHVIGVTSCTAALFLSLKALGIGEGDEVITTPMTFIATPNSIIHAGAKPVFVEVEKETGNINANLIIAAITPRTRAIMPVHLYGQMCDMHKLSIIAKKYRLAIIEDAAHALEAKRDGIGVGMLSNCACFSFYATKNITCGEGGAISTNSMRLAGDLKKLRLHGMSKSAADRYSNKYKHWEMNFLGWKYNMDDIHAALLINQLKHINTYRQRREDICRMYEEHFKNMPEVRILKIVDNSVSARHLFTILVDPRKRDRIMHQLQDRGIGVAVNYRAVHLLKYYRKSYGYTRGMFPIAEQIGDSTITLPLYPKLTEKEVKYIIHCVKDIV